MLSAATIDQDIRSVYSHIPVQDIVYAVHISLRFKYIYTITPKCACSTLRLALRRLELDERHADNVEMKLIHSREYSPTLTPRQVSSFKALVERSDFFKFCVVKDPYVRLLSSYLDRIERNKPEKASVLSALGYEGMPIDTPISFDQFVRFVCSQSIECMNPHWRVQYYQSLQGGIKYDFVGKVETFTRVIQALESNVSASIRSYLPARPLNQTLARDRLQEFYTHDLVRLVNSTFEIDFKTFGYEMH